MIISGSPVSIQVLAAPDQMKAPPATTSTVLHHRNRFQYFLPVRFGALISHTPTKAAAFFLLLLLSYTIGYLSATALLSSNSPVPIPVDDHSLFGSKCGDPLPPGGAAVRKTIVDRVFNGTSPWDGFPPPHARELLATTHRDRIRGWGSKGAVFENLIRRVQPKTIIEVGTFLGASALHMAHLTRQLGLPDTQILCIDDFRGWPGFQFRHTVKAERQIKTVNGDVMLLYQFMQNVVHANATESVMFMPFSSGSGLEQLCQWGVSGDLIEVDAGHDFHSAWSDINRAYKILRRPGGVLFGHDYFTSADNRGVRRAVHLFARLHNLRVRVDGQHWLLTSSS